MFLLFDFLLFEKMFQKIKYEIKCERTLEMLTVAFGESTMSRRKVEKMPMKMLVLVDRARQQPMNTLKQ